jgi:hypothetical protein
MDKEVWPQIWKILANDAHFRVFEQARLITGKFNGQISQLIHDGYLTFQMVAIRRLCDDRKDVISLRRALTETKQEQLASPDQIDRLLQILDSCDHVCEQTSQYIAHTANPARRPNVPAWNMQMKHLTEARKAICTVAVTLDRDLLRRKNFIEIFPVPQFDFMEDIRLWVPANKIQELYKFWHAHVKSVNEWGRSAHG